MVKDFQHDFVETVNKEFLKCAACGECRMVCPVYSVSGLEKNVARGRLSLAKAVADGKLELTANIQASFDNCLLCMACVKNCAGHVDMVEVVLKSRAFLSSKKKLPGVKNLAFKALTSKRKYLDVGFKGARAAQSVFMTDLPEKSGLRLKLSLPQFAELSKRVLPVLPEKPFIEKQDRVYEAKKEKDRVLLFVGCAGNYIYTGIAEKAVQLLNALGVSVVVLSGQNCCGAPVQAHADSKNLEKLAVENVQSFSKIPSLSILTICSSGGLMLKKHYTQILAGSELENEAMKISLRTMDISVYLAEQIGIDKIKSNIKQKISRTLTYHDPCHLGLGQNVTTQPRALLKAVCEKFEEMPDAHKCCGLGGTYGMSHSKVSDQILDKKIKSIENMKNFPALLSTGCPACIMQLQHGLYKKGLNVRVKHFVQYLWQALI